MAKSALTFAVISLLLLHLSFTLVSGLTEIVKTWCIAKPSSSDEILQFNTDYSCDHANCGPSKIGGPCFNPNALIHHASYGMSAYYQSTARQAIDCNFKNTALIALTDPSSQTCHYPGGETNIDLSETGKWCVAKPTTEKDMLQAIIDFACSHVDCSSTKPGGGCLSPTTAVNHASVAMNLYYQAFGDCDFKGTGVIVMSNPGYDNCKYPYVPHGI
ncbi:Glucan endo-1,3-beta-glucosidase [Quillaja saponaria]|uniref:Glucan endo-1,3-beta-glucosidase n=1 Tax=Quillaja saponaria TaxID=32244 RepID=A0AAD7PVG8_QUISA|nr:Glucan endo-1,3-beta-glucosidase [Quillaja saponaria]